MTKSVDDRFIWFKGDIIPASQALISALSPSAQYGLSVFEGIRAYWNNHHNKLYLFRFDDHITRLFQSCKLVGLTFPYSRDFIFSAFIDVIEANNYCEDVALRLTVFVDDEGSWASLSSPDMLVAPIAKSRLDLDNLKSESACISSWLRVNDQTLPPRIKLGANYLNSRYAFLEAKSNGYMFPILSDSSGKISESSGSCVFMVKNNVLITPSLTSSVLESITRDTILKLALFHNLEVEERDIDRTELFVADELFLCGSAVEVQPLYTVNQFIIGDGSIGPITKLLLSAYHCAVDGRDYTKYNWVLPV